MKKKDIIAQAAEGLGCLGRADDEEDLFILRAQDRFAPQLIEQWAWLSNQHGGNPAKISEALECAKRMQDWPVKKYPD